MSCRRDLVTVPPSLTSTHSEKPVDLPSLPTEPSPVPTKGVPPPPPASAKPGGTKVPPGLPTTPKGKSRRKGGFPEDFEMDLTMERSGRYETQAFPIRVGRALKHVRLDRFPR